MGNKIDREVRNQWETKKGMKKTINQQSQIINKQSRSSMLQYMRHGIMYKELEGSNHETYSACTNVLLSFGNLIFVWLFGNFNPGGPAATPLRPASRPAAVTLIAARARVRRQRQGTQ
jgi:hypothetical protein